VDLLNLPKIAFMAAKKLRSQPDISVLKN